MTIPESCKAWAAEMLAAGGAAARFMENLQAEECLAPAVQHRFFEELEAILRDRASDPYLFILYDVLATQGEELLCKGPVLPADQFRVLFRVDDVDALRYRAPKWLDRRGIRDGELIRELDEEELRVLVDEYDGEVILGNQFGIVWVTDFEAVRDGLTRLSELCDRLGLVHLASPLRLVLCAYSRADLPWTLHLPRSLDALGYEQFEMTVECDPEAGRTHPITLPPERGLPEGVHRGCRVVPRLWQYGGSA